MRKLIIVLMLACLILVGCSNGHPTNGIFTENNATSGAEGDSDLDIYKPNQNTGSKTNDFLVNDIGIGYMVFDGDNVRHRPINCSEYDEIVCDDVVEVIAEVYVENVPIDYSLNILIDGIVQKVIWSNNNSEVENCGKLRAYEKKVFHAIVEKPVVSDSDNHILTFVAAGFVKAGFNEEGTGNLCAIGSETFNLCLKGDFETDICTSTETNILTGVPSKWDKSSFTWLLDGKPNGCESLPVPHQYTLSGDSLIMARRPETTGTYYAYIWIDGEMQDTRYQFNYDNRDSIVWFELDGDYKGKTVWAASFNEKIELDQFTYSYYVKK